GFLAAEAARFAVAVPKCRYWQQDHWSVQVAPDTTAIVHWDGSYWFDKGNGTGAARLRNFAIGDQPAGPDQAADLIAPLDPDLAMVIRRYGEGAGGGGGATFCLGFREPWCAAAETPLACGGDPGDACAVANARSDADAACDCTTAPTHRQYVACVARVAGAGSSRRRPPPRPRGGSRHGRCGPRRPSPRSRRATRPSPRRSRRSRTRSSRVPSARRSTARSPGRTRERGRCRPARST